MGVRLGHWDTRLAFGGWLGSGQCVSKSRTISTEDNTSENNVAYLENALARAFLQLTFWLSTNESTVTAIARSMSWAEQYSERRILQNASAIRMIASK